jgi:hypothetical protein
MSHRDGQSYAKDYDFSQQELAAITPTELVQWVCHKVYGKGEPDEDDNLIEGRSNSLLYWKKAISFSCRIINKHGMPLQTQEIQQSLLTSMS